MEETSPNEESEETTTVPSGEMVTITFKADYPNPVMEGTVAPQQAEADTRTTIAEDGTVAWEVADEITLYYMEGNTPANAPATALTAGPSADFQVTIPDGVTEVYAVYPAGKGELTPDGVFKVKTGGAQDGSFEQANYAAAWAEISDEMNLSFKNVVGLFRIRLPEGGIIEDGDVNHTIKSISIAGKKSEPAFLGDVTVTVGDDGALAFSAPENAATEAVVELDEETRNAGYAYIPSLPVTSADGLVFRFMNTEGIYLPAAVTKDDKAITLDRGHLKPVNTACESVIFDWYFAEDGQGDGKSAASPAGVEDFQKLINDSQYLYGERRLDGARLNLAPGTYSLTEQLNINSDIVVAGENMEGTMIDGAELGAQMIIIDAAGSLTARYLTIQNANNTAKGAAIAANGAIFMENCKLYNNVTTGSNSGAMIISKEARFENCVFESNKAKTQGGAFSIGGTVTADIIVNNCTFKSNAVTGTGSNGGGAIYHAGLCRLLIDNSSFINNSASSQGGAIKMEDKEGNQLFVNRSLFRSNTISASGYHQPNGCAAVYQGAADKSKCGFYNCTFSYNHASSDSSQTPVIRASRYIIANSTFVEATASGYGVINNAAKSADASTLVNNIVTINSDDENHVSLSTKVGKNDDGTTTYNHLTSGYNLVTRILPGFTVASDGTTKTGVQKSTINLGQEEDIDIENKLIYWEGNVSAVEGYVNCKLSDVESAIKTNTVLGADFWNWLKSIKVGAYDATQVDVRGVLRDPDLMWPGSYQGVLQQSTESAE